MEVSEGWTSISGLLKRKDAKVFQLKPDILQTLKLTNGHISYY